MYSVYYVICVTVSKDIVVFLRKLFYLRNFLWYYSNVIRVIQSEKLLRRDKLFISKWLTENKKEYEDTNKLVGSLLIFIEQLTSHYIDGMRMILSSYFIYLSLTKVDNIFSLFLFLLVVFHGTSNSI